MPHDNAKPNTVDRLLDSVPAALAMMAGLDLGVFTALGNGPMSAAALAARIGCDEDRLARLLHALVLAGLLEKHGGAEASFADTAEADAFLVAGKPDYRGGSPRLTTHLWEADCRTAQSIRSGAPAALHDFEHSPDEILVDLFRDLHPETIGTAKDLMADFDFGTVRAVIDIGGGTGGLVATLCTAFPTLRGTLFELPRCARLLEPTLRATPGGAGVAVEAGDILAAPPRIEAPDRLYDVAVLRALVQVLGRDEARRAISNAAAVLKPGGTLYIVGAGILDDDRLGPPSAVFINLTFLNLYTAGRSHTESEHRAWLAAAGCGNVQRKTLASGRSAIVATRL